MMLKEERHTPHAVAFKVNFIDVKNIANQEEPEIKKKLESYAAQGPALTLELIQEKLHKAEEKRKLSQPQPSPKYQERRLAAIEKKKTLDQENAKHRAKVERDLSEAHEKRRMTREQRKQKLREHIAMVEVRRKEQAVKRKTSTENMMQQIEKKMEVATHKRDETLEQVISVAHHSAEKKKHSDFETTTQPAPKDLLL